jgi:hypothetical protein
MYLEDFFIEPQTPRLTVTARAPPTYVVPTVTSRSSPTPFTIGVFAFRGIEPMYLGISTLFIPYHEVHPFQVSVLKIHVFAPIQLKRNLNYGNFAGLQIKKIHSQDHIYVLSLFLQPQSTHLVPLVAEFLPKMLVGLIIPI